MDIQPLTEQDLAAALEVYRQCEDFLALGPQARASMAMVCADMQLSRSNGGIFCGLYDSEQRLIGILDYIPAHFENNPKHAFIELMMIGNPFRNKGLGRQVVSWVEQEVRQRAQAEAIYSGVQTNNPAAIRFWLKMGYQIISGPEPQPDQTIAFRLFKALVPQDTGSSNVSAAT